MYLCKVLDEILHALVKVFSSESGWLCRVQVRETLTQVRGEEVGIEPNNIDWVCVERGREGGSEKGREMKERHSPSWIWR